MFFYDKTREWVGKALMKKVLVLGSGGSGKSTLLRELADRGQFALVHLEAYCWPPGWVPPFPDDWRQTVAALVQRDRCLGAAGSQRRG